MVCKSQSNYISKFIKSKTMYYSSTLRLKISIEANTFNNYINRGSKIDLTYESSKLN